MEIKSSGSYILSVNLNERTYQLSIPYGSPFGESYDVVFQFLQEIIKMQNQAVENMKKTSEETTKGE